MTSLQWIIIGLISCGVLAILVLYALSAYFGFKNVFPGSGVPEQMANILFRGMYFYGQILVGIIVIALVVLMMTFDKITENAGLPIITAIVGYLLGASPRDTNSGSGHKNHNLDE